MTDTPTARTVHLESAGTALVLEPRAGGSGLPEVLHWGAALEGGVAAYEALGVATIAPVPHSALDAAVAAHRAARRGRRLVGHARLVGSPRRRRRRRALARRHLRVRGRQLVTRASSPTAYASSCGTPSTTTACSASTPR